MVLRAGLVACALLAAGPVAADDSLATEAPAAWKKQEVDFLYMGFTTRYSCGGLKSKVRLLLKHLGVRDDFKIVERSCEFGYQHVADFPRLKLTFYVPYLPEPGTRDVGDPVLGVWKAVTIKRNSPRGLELGDCEMVEIFRDRILPLFVTRGMEGDVSCIPHQLVGNRMNLQFEVLTGVKSVDTAAQAQNQDR